MDHLFKKDTALTPMSPISVGLLTADPGDSGTSSNCNEVPETNNYSRIVTIADNWNVSAGGIITNTDDLAFPGSTGSWGTVTHFALFTSQVYGLGELIIHGVLDVSKPVPSGYQVRFNSGQLTIALD